ncbi:MAG: hypothetical protein ABEJ02_03520 [Candidatus Paceibacteria bacterium]
MRKQTSLVLVLAYVLFVSSAEAKEPKATGALDVSVSTPIVTETGELFAPYMYVGGSIAIPISKKFVAITGGGVQVAIGKSNYGASGFVTGEYVINGWLAFDTTMLVSTDINPALRPVLGRNHTFFLSVGGGPVFFLPKGVGVAVQATYDKSLDGLGDSISPSLTLSVPF